MLNSRKLSSLIFGCVISVIFFSGCSSEGAKAAAPRGAGRGGSQPPMPVSVASAKIQDVPVYLTGLGNVVGYNTVTVKSRIDGQLVQVPIREGQEVEKGDLLALIDPKKDALKGPWGKDGRLLVCNATEYDRIQVPYIPPDEYDLQATILRRSGDQSIVLGLARGNSQWGPNFDFYHGGMLKSGVERMDGKQPEFNSLVYTGGRVFYVGKRVRLEAQVRRTGFKITADEKVIFSYTGDYKNLDMSGSWKMQDGKTLWLGLWNGETVFERLVLIPVSGQGKKLR